MRPVGRRGLSLAAVALAVASTALTSCADADLKAANADAEKKVGSSCAAPTAAATLPADFPDLPLLPPGAVVTSVEARDKNRTVVGAVVAQPFKALLKDTQQRYQGAGLVLDHGEVEEHDAESNFHGHGFEGRWGLRAVPDCPGSTTVSLVVAPTS